MMTYVAVFLAGAFIGAVTLMTIACIVAGGSAERDWENFNKENK